MKLTRLFQTACASAALSLVACGAGETAETLGSPEAATASDTAALGTPLTASVKFGSGARETNFAVGDQLQLLGACDGRALPTFGWTVLRHGTPASVGATRNFVGPALSVTLAFAANYSVTFWCESRTHRVRSEKTIDIEVSAERTRASIVREVSVTRAPGEGYGLFLGEANNATILRIVQGSAAARSSLKQGERIVSIDGVDTASADLISMLTAAGSTAVLGVISPEDLASYRSIVLAEARAICPDPHVGEAPTPTAECAVTAEPATDDGDESDGYIEVLGASGDADARSEGAGL